MNAIESEEGKSAGTSSNQAEMPLTIDSADVVKLILQYLKENSLLTSMHQLQKETGVSLNTVDNIEQFQSNIRQGRWDSVLHQISTLKLPATKVTMLYEQIVFEMLESGERELARELLRSCDSLSRLRIEQPERYLKLETLSRRSYFSEVDAYEMGSTKESRRQELAIDLASEVTCVEPSRLLALIGQALKYQQSIGLISPGVPFDVFKGLKKLAKKDGEDVIIRKEMEVIPKGSRETHIQTLQFSTDGQAFLLAGKAGFIELWDTDSLKPKTELEYQQLGNFINQGTSVLSLAISKDSEQFAVGSDSGQVKIWKISNGQTIKILPQAHRAGILSITFNKDFTHLLTTSMDMTARIHGLKSGKVLKEFRGHTSFVNSGLYTKENNQVITGSSDGTVRIWDAKTTECLNSIRPAAVASDIELIDIAVRKLSSVPNQPDQTLICIRQSNAVLMSNLTGQILQVYSVSKKSGCDFVSATFSAQGKWLYCASEDKNIYIFEAKTGRLEETFPIQTTSEIVDIVHHPQRNLLAILTRDGQISMAVP